jgi:sulfide:quinone oxidoreductase
MKKITIVGAGFAAISAIRRLRKRGFDGEIAVLAPEPYFLYYPSLIWIPTGLRSAADLRIPLEGFFARNRVRFVKGTAVAVEEGGRSLRTDQGRLEQDALIIASGGRSLKALPGIEHTLAICDPFDAERIRERLAALSRGRIAVGFAGNPKEPQAVRGGPAFEILFGIETYLRKRGLRGAIELVFFNPMTEPGNRLGSKAVQRILAEMKTRGITTHLGHKLKGFTERAVLTEGGDIEADLILFLPGLTGPAWAAEGGLPLSPGGFIRADTTCAVEGMAGVFVAGDAGSYAGAPEWLPKQGHMADLQGVTAADNALLHLEGKAPAHHFRPEIVCIVDTLSSGVLVYRTPSRGVVLPNPLWHAAKRAFEWHYLRPLRRAA